MYHLPPPLKMINKYTIELRQFNNGEEGRITFPTFEQCMMYGMHKLKRALIKKVTLIKAILLEDPHGRKIVVSPSDEELEDVPSRVIVMKSKHKAFFKIKTSLDGDELDIIL